MERNPRRHQAALSFSYSSPVASAIARALTPEAAASEVPKTAGRAALSERGLDVHLEADDLASLRATMNSHLRWVDAAAKAAAIARDGSA